MIKQTHFLLLFFLLFSFHLSATNYTSINAGDWNDPNTWSPTGIPNVSSSASWPGDNVTIGHTVSFNGDLTTGLKGSILIMASGSLSIEGNLNINNSNDSSFSVEPSGLLTANIINIPSCCNHVTLAGNVTAVDLNYSGSSNGELTISGDIQLSGNFTTDGGNSILFNGGSIDVGGSTNNQGSVQLYITNEAQLNLGDLSLTGASGIEGQGDGGIIGFSSIYMQSTSTNISCSNNACNFNASTPPPPNVLDLATGLATTAIFPVKLLAFDAVLTDGKTSITWATAQEQDNDFFLLEYSTDGSQFRELAKINGAGSSTHSQYYSLSHHIDAPTQYYRLIQFDYDGSSNVLGLRVVHNGTLSGLRISPNPVQGDQVLSIQHTTNTPIDKVILIGLNGQSQQLVFSGNRINLPTSLTKGMYYLQVVQSNRINNVPLIIQ